jgi:protein CMS1
MSKASVNMAETQTPKTQDKKRKRDDGDKTAPASKKQERSKDKKLNSKTNNYNNNKNKNKKGQDDKKSNKESSGYKQPQREEAVDESISKMNEQILADYFLQKAKSHNKDLTAVELSDMSVPGRFILRNWIENFLLSCC